MVKRKTRYVIVCAHTHYFRKEHKKTLTVVRRAWLELQNCELAGRGTFFGVFLSGYLSKLSLSRFYQISSVFPPSAHLTNSPHSSSSRLPSSVAGHLCWFQCLVILKNVAMDLLVHVSSQCA